ncbi:MAG: DUF983 domain-containing protein [Ferruginibacter sp.]
MKEEKQLPTPNALWSMITMKCPRCRRGEMFCNSSAYRKLSLKHIFAMPDNCSLCGQKYDMEPGFWYGTSYVSYALTVALSVATFVAWVVLIGVSVKDGDNRIYWWLGINAVVLIVAQPWLMRFSRVLYIRFFVSYDKDFEKTTPKEFE